MTSNEILKKYVEYTFASDVKVEYSSSFTANVELKDGCINLMCLGECIYVYLNDELIQNMVYHNGSFRLIRVY